MATVGEKWKTRFHIKLLPIMYSINLHKYTATPTHCAGGWDSGRNEFDPMLDAAYHTANPSAPTCINGLVGTIEVVPIKGFYFDSLESSMIKMFEVGNLDVNEGVFIVDGFVDLSNVVAVEYPAGVYHSIIFSRNLSVTDSVVAQYGKVKKTDYTPQG